MCVAPKYGPVFEKIARSQEPGNLSSRSEEAAVSLSLLGRRLHVQQIGFTTRAGFYKSLTHQDKLGRVVNRSLIGSGWRCGALRSRNDLVASRGRMVFGLKAEKNKYFRSLKCKGKLEKAPRADPYSRKPSALKPEVQVGLRTSVPDHHLQECQNIRSIVVTATIVTCPQDSNKSSEFPKHDERDGPSCPEAELELGFSFKSSSFVEHIGSKLRRGDTKTDSRCSCWNLAHPWRTGSSCWLRPVLGPWHTACIVWSRFVCHVSNAESC